MNICLVTTEYPPGPMGGIGTYCINVVEELAKRGHQVTVVTKDFGGSPSRARRGSTMIYRLGTRHLHQDPPIDLSPDLFATEMTYLRHYCGLFAREVAEHLPLLHQKHAFDIILSQDIEAPTWLLQEKMFLFNEMADVPVVVFVHSPHRDCTHFNADTLFERHEYHRILYETHSMALADHLLFASEYMRSGLVNSLGCDRTHTTVIPYPLGDVAERYPFANRVGGTRSKQQVVVYAGRIELRKGVEDLIRAFVPLVDENPNLSLHLYGRDCPHPTLNGTVSDVLTRKYIPPALQERICFFGALEREKLWDRYGQATLGVVPSLWEPFGFVCQEMMATGLPVVATKEGGMAEMVVDGASGFLCESGVDSLRDTLRRALALPAAERKAVGDAASDRIRCLCDNDRVLEETQGLFERIGSARQTARGASRRQPVPSNLPFGDRPLSLPHPRTGSGSPPCLRNVAAIIPYYNLGDYLDGCVNSLLRQTRPPEQIIIVNDGSTDSVSLATLDSYRKRGGLVSILDFENGGLPVARNRGGRYAIEAGAEGLVFLDADDELEPTYLAKATEVLNRHPEAGAVTAWTHTIGRMHTWWAPFHAQFPYLLAECMSTPPALVRAPVFQEVQGFSPDLRYAYEDWDLWISLCERGYAMLVIPEPLIIYRMRSGSISQEYRSTTLEHGRRTMVQRHPAVFREYGAEALLLVESFLYAARGQSNGSADISDELRKCQDFIAYLGSLPGRPVEATRFAVRKVLGRLGSRLRTRARPGSVA